MLQLFSFLLWAVKCKSRVFYPCRRNMILFHFCGHFLLKKNLAASDKIGFILHPSSSVPLAAVVERQIDWLVFFCSVSVSSEFSSFRGVLPYRLFICKIEHRFATQLNWERAKFFSWYLPPQDFGPEAKTRGGTLGVPGCIHSRTKNICWKSKKCVCNERSVLDLTKLGAHGGLG